ncbi:hypothetical protein BH10CHL1_BH10CHL1_17170 [soil metagenome]
MNNSNFESVARDFPFVPHFQDIANFQMHYVNEGAGEPIVLIHGDPTWDIYIANSYRRWHNNAVA